MNLKEKICLVTGGNRGIGSAIVEELASSGAYVYFTYREGKDTAEALVNKLTSVGCEASCMQMDVIDRESVQRVMARISETHKRLDVLVNNAGINNPTDFDKITDTDWDLIINVNLKGPFIVSQEALRLLKLSDSSSIVNIGSVSGQYGGPRTAHYAASKAGLISLGQVIARFGAQYNIRCNTLAAGLIRSEMAEDGLKSSVVANAAENILLKRMGYQNEVAKVVVFLASHESSYITAQTINVNGGIYF